MDCQGGDKVQYKSKNRGKSPLCYKCGSVLVNNPLYNQVKSCPYCDRICGKCNGVGHRTEECDEYQRQQEICDKCGRTLWQHSNTGYSCEEWNENVKICSVCGRSHPEGEEVCERNLIRDFLYSLDQQN